MGKHASNMLAELMLPKQQPVCQGIVSQGHSPSLWLPTCQDSSSKLPVVDREARHYMLPC
jgi:hypothetical protein